MPDCPSCKEEIFQSEIKEKIRTDYVMADLGDGDGENKEQLSNKP